MDSNTSKEIDFLVDLETGETSCEEEISNEPVPDDRQAKTLLTRIFSEIRSFNGSSRTECASSYSNWGKYSEITHETVKLLIDDSSGGQSCKHVLLAGKKNAKEKRKIKNSKKAPKPPRPPKGPSLDATDMRLVKEISELAMKKRARIEHMKALKKMKATKSSTSLNSTLSAMVVTLIFCLIIIFQGIYSRNGSGASFQESPEPAAATNGLISVQFYNNLSPIDGIGLNSESPNTVEQFSGSEFSLLERVTEDDADSELVLAVASSCTRRLQLSCMLLCTGLEGYNFFLIFNIFFYKNTRATSVFFCVAFFNFPSSFGNANDKFDSKKGDRLKAIVQVARSHNVKW